MNEIRKALEAGIDALESQLADGKYRKAVAKRLREALALLPPEGEMRGECIHCGECEKPIGEFHGCPALLRPAPSSEKALREAAANAVAVLRVYAVPIPRAGSDRPLRAIDEQAWTVINALEALLASSPAPSVECPSCLGRGYNTDTQGEREKCGWCQGIGRVNQAPAPEAPK